MTTIDQLGTARSRAYLRESLAALQLPCSSDELCELLDGYRDYRTQADQVLAVDLDLVVGSELNVGPRQPRAGVAHEPLPRSGPPPGDGPRTLTAAATELRAGALSSRALFEEGLLRARGHDDDLGSYVTRFDGAAARAADSADAMFAAGIDHGPLQGIPIGIKDNLIVADGPTTAQSTAMPDTPRVDAEAVRRLRAAGAVITGKLTLMEFATGLPDPEDCRFPTPRNPWDRERWSGGSSSGSAAAVSAEFVLGALGTDTGGSIRNPAAFCGVTGFKPTYGSVSRTGMVPLAPSMDCVGPIARTADDCAVILSVIAPELPRGGRWQRSLAGLVVGVDRAGMVDIVGAEPGVVRAFDKALAVLRSAGAVVVDIEIPHLHVLRFVMRLLIDSERLALHLVNLHERWDNYSPTFRTKVRRGVFASAPELAKAHLVRADARNRVDRLLDTVDVIASPTSLYTAPLVARLQTDNRPELQMTPPWSVLGHPAVSIPMGFADNGMPVGLQLAGRRGDDHGVLDIAAVFQQRTGWHRIAARLQSKQ
jgi:aspartyl-tRNA(Asn)/glutamyl-tRNA(Gln) amidotransferase subunit A